MALGGIYETGTVTIGGDRVSVTGVGTFWSPIAEIGDWLFIGGQVGLIGAVVDDTHLTLESQWQGTLPSAAVYVIVKMSWLRYDPALTQSKVRQLLEELHAQGNFLFVEGDEPDDAMGEDGQWALKTNATPWQLWLKVDGVWVQQAPPAGLRWRGAWSSVLTYSAADGVQYLGSSFVSKTENTNQPPDINPDDWDLMAAKGDVGPTGPAGPAVTTGSIDPVHLNADTAAEQEAFRVKLAAAPFDAMAYNGMQVNGSMEVSQESTAGTSINASYFSDGWKLYKQGTMVAGAQIGGLFGYFPGLPLFTSVVLSTAQPTLGALDHVFISQPIEGYRTARLGWGTAGAKPITIGFWSAHEPAGSYSVSIRSGNFARSCVMGYVQSAAGVPQYNAVTFPGDTTGSWVISNAVAMWVEFTFAAGPSLLNPSFGVWSATTYIAGPGQVNGASSTANAFRMTGVVVLPGTQAPTAAQSPLIMRPYDQELVTCKRYYQPVIGGCRATAAGAATVVETTLNYQEMRAAPTVAIGTPGFSLNNAAAPYTTDISSKSLRFLVNSAAAGDCYALVTPLKLDARL